MDAVRKVDSRGRLLLGEEFAGSMVIVEKNPHGDLVVKRAAVVPAREKWLHENSTAMDLVQAGLDAAVKGQISSNPAFEESLSWIDELED